MKEFVLRLLKDEDGGVAIEYTFLVVFVALIAAFGMQALGTGISDFFTAIAEGLAGIDPIFPDPPVAPDPA